MNSHNSFDSFFPKVEIDVDNDHSNSGFVSKSLWTPENTMKLIKMYESECQELWNPKLPGYKDKAVKKLRYEYLADTFRTTVEEITRKLHNLRSQYNNELRKIKKRHGEGGVAVSAWDYFNAFAFLTQPSSEPDANESMLDPLEMVESVNIELAEFQAKEEEVFRIKPETSMSPNPPKKVLRVAASCPPPLPPRVQPFMWAEKPSIQPGLNADECQIFGDFVASELRTLRSIESRKKLKRMIQKAILEIGEEDGVNNS